MKRLLDLWSQIAVLKKQNPFGCKIRKQARKTTQVFPVFCVQKCKIY